VALILALLVPAVAGVWLLGVARTARAAQGHLIALGASVVTLVLVLLVAWLRPDVNSRWVPALGLRWHFAVDGITIPLILLTAALTVGVVLHSRGREPGGGVEGGGSASTYYACLLLIEFAALATFLTRDAIAFFIAFELVLIPMWILISRFGDEHVSDAVRADASNRFVFFTVLGSTLMLLGILVLVTTSGTSDLTVLAARHGAGTTQSTQVLVAALLVTGLGIKVPLWPAHTWLPPAHTVAPTAGSVLLAAVLLKMGTYGIIRVALPTVPQGFATVSPYLAACGAVGIIWGGLACLVERDLKRLVAYSSVAHMGFVALGLASGTQTGLQAALFANIAHGLVSALLFVVVGGLKERWGSADLGVARTALRETSPRMGCALVIGAGAPGPRRLLGRVPRRVCRMVAGRRPARRALPRLRPPRRVRHRPCRGLRAAGAPARLAGPPGKHPGDRSVRIHPGDRSVRVHLGDRSVRSHAGDRSVRVHLGDRSHVGDRSLPSHLGDRSLPSHLGERSLRDRLRNQRIAVPCPNGAILRYRWWGGSRR